MNLVSFIILKNIIVNICIVQAVFMASKLVCTIAAECYRTSVRKEVTLFCDHEGGGEREKD